MGEGHTLVASGITRREWGFFFFFFFCPGTHRTGETATWLMLENRWALSQSPEEGSCQAKGVAEQRDRGRNVQGGCRKNKHLFA